MNPRPEWRLKPCPRCGETRIEQHRDTCGFCRDPKKHQGQAEEGQQQR